MNTPTIGSATTIYIISRVNEAAPTGAAPLSKGGSLLIQHLKRVVAAGRAFFTGSETSSPLRNDSSFFHRVAGVPTEASVQSQGAASNTYKNAVGIHVDQYEWLKEILSMAFQNNGRNVSINHLNRNYSDLPVNDVRPRSNDVRQSSNDADAMVAHWVNDPGCRDWIDECYSQELKAIKDGFDRALSELDDKAGIGMASQEYLDKIGELSAKREEALAQFYKEKIIEIFS